jgi:hypothetical protein
LAYIAVALLGIVLTFLNFDLEVLRGNISHLRNGRAPNAGAAVFPSLPLNPILLAGLAWLLDHLHPHAGLWAVSAIFFVSFPAWALSRRNLQRQLDQLKTRATDEERAA